MYEEIMCRCVDLMAENNNKEAELLLNGCILKIKENIQKGIAEMESFYAWGMCLSILEEYEQAILKFEKVLDYNSNHEEALWQITDILFYHLGKAKTAQVILEEKLTKLNPGNSTYQKTLRDIQSYLSRETNRKSG